MAFPAEPVPDGHILGPHHLYIGVGVMVLVAAVVWDNYPQREPVLYAAAGLAALFAFQYVWPFYPATGAALSLAALLAALSAPLLPGWFWSNVTLPVRLAAVLAVVVALDDVVSHALGVWTPLDALWKAAIYPVVG